MSPIVRQIVIELRTGLYGSKDEALWQHTIRSPIPKVWRWTALTGSAPCRMSLECCTRQATRPVTPAAEKRATCEVVRLVTPTAASTATLALTLQQPPRRMHRGFAGHGGCFWV